MPTIAEQLIGSVAQTSTQVPDMAKAISSGADLAAQAENIQAMRQKIEQAKEQQEFLKIKQIGDWYETASKMPEGGARNAFVNNFVPEAIKGIGMADKVNPTVMKMINAQPDIVSYLKAKMEAKDPYINMAKIRVALNDPATMAELMKATELEKFGGEQALRSAFAEYPQTLEAASSKGIENLNKYERALLAPTSAAERQATQISSAGKIEAAKDTAKLYANFSAAGGKQNVISNLEKMKGALAQLESGEVKTGGLSGVTLKNYETALAVVNPGLKALIDNVRGGVNMRAALADPNPTEMQVSTILSRAIDPALPTEENIKKLRTMIDETEQGVLQRQNEFIKQGFMTQKEAYEGSVPQWKKDLANVKAKAKALPADKKKDFIQRMATKYNVTSADIEKELSK
jgi:hypothetical protein